MMALQRLPKCVGGQEKVLRVMGIGGGGQGGAEAGAFRRVVGWWVFFPSNSPIMLVFGRSMIILGRMVSVFGWLLVVFRLIWRGNKRT